MPRDDVGSGRGDRGHGVMADVEVEVEVGVLDPVREIQPERDFDEAAPERRQQMEPLADGGLRGFVAGATGRVARVVDVQRRDMPERGRRLHVQETGVDAAQLLHQGSFVADALKYVPATVDDPQSPAPGDQQGAWRTEGLRLGTAAMRGCSPTGLGVEQCRACRRDGQSILVDTLFDLRLTDAMLEAWSRWAPRHHDNGQHPST